MDHHEGPYTEQGRPILYTPTKYDGRYYIGGRLGVGIGVQKRPPWLHRFLMNYLLGIEWVDEEFDA